MLYMILFHYNITVEIKFLLVVIVGGKTTGGGFKTLGGDITHCFISTNKKLTIMKNLQYTPSLSL